MKTVINKVMDKNRDGMNVQLPQTIKVSGLYGYVYLYHSTGGWKRRHTNSLPQNDLFIFIGEVGAKIPKIEFIG